MSDTSVAASLVTAGGYASGAAGSAGDIAAAQEKTAVDYESFLRLLTAQLQNQDPLAPMDATQFVSQLAQFSTVEQGMQSNRKLSELLETLKSSSSRFDMAYLGRRVEAATDVVGLKDGEAKAAYAVDASAASVRIDILDAEGVVVRTIKGETGAGRHSLVWDGKRADGTAAPEGPYRLQVIARNAAGDTVPSATVVSDTIKEIQQVDGSSLFLLEGGGLIRAEDMLSVS
jgi:flagellar basal-body rod modification protein FlgD